MNKATSWEDKYSEIEEAYRYAESVRSFLFACMGVNPSYDSKREFEAIGIQDAIDQLKNQADNLRAVADLEKIDRILGRDSNNILKVLRSCDLMLSALTEISTLEEAPAKLPVDKIRFFREIPEDILHLSYSGFSKYVDLLVRAYGKIVDLLQPGTFNRSQTEELETVYRSLPGILAYQNSSTANKPKKSRSSEAIRKEKDFLYLLDRYEAWKAKTTEKTRKKRLNPKGWLREYALWTDKTLAIYRRYVSTKLKDGKSQEIDPSSKLAQGRIDSIIKYAQKIKRERFKGDE
jgi:hypothetical protein